MADEQGTLENGRATLGRMQNPVRGLLHGSAALASLIGLVFLVVRADTAMMRTGAVVFGLGLIGLFTTSSLYHSVPWPDAWKQRMQRLDHSMIFVLIAATYTPTVLAGFEGGRRVAALTVVWLIAGIGIANRVLASMDKHGASFALMVAMGWLAFPFAGELVDRMGSEFMTLIAVGGLLYTVGMVFKVTHWPRLWPRVFSAHELFHVLVVTAAIVHWTAIYRYALVG